MTIKFIFNRAHEEEVLRAEKAIIYFSASFCNSCQNFYPIYSEIADNYKHINFYKVDINESYEFTNKFKIISTPTFIFLNKGEKINEIIGVDKNKLLEFIQFI